MGTLRLFVCIIILSTLSSAVATAAPGDLLFKLTAPDPQIGAGFGDELSVFDGKILVGEPNRRSGGLFFVGRAYLFDAKTGQLEHAFNDPEPVNRSTFGTSVAGGDGSVFIGSGDLIGRGRIHAFDQTTGQLQFRIDSPDGGRGSFGSSIAYGAGGLLVSAPSFSVPGDEGISIGQAYLYDVSTRQLSLTIPNPEPSRQEIFGSGDSLALFDNKLAVGSFADNSFDGLVWIFDRSSRQPLFRLENPNPDRGPPHFLPDRFGWSVAADEELIVVGADEDDASGVDASGTVYVFDSQTGALKHTLFSPQPEINGEFGRSVAVTPQGDVLVGAWRTSVNGIAAAGHAYLFDGDSGSLLLDIPNPEPDDGVFGWTVAALDGAIVVGAPVAEAVYVFETIPEPSSFVLAALLLIISFAIRHIRTLKAKSALHVNARGNP